MKCSILKKVKHNICINLDEELILSDNISENDRYNSIINHYKIQRKSENNLLAGISTLEDVIKVATAQDVEKKKKPHQFRIPNICLAEFCENILSNIDQIKSANSFESLHNLIKVCKIKGIGKLCIYDTSQMIGLYLRLYPNFIYLHSGTLQGAKKILGKIKGDRISKNILPDAFQRSDLSCSEIEDILCIYKDKF